VVGSRGYSVIFFQVCSGRDTDESGQDACTTGRRRPLWLSAASIFCGLPPNRKPSWQSKGQMEANDRAARVLAGDQDSFRVLVEQHSRAIFRLAFRMTGNEHDAEDIVQDTFLRAYRGLRQFEARANFGTWLHRVAINCALDHLRRAKRREEEPYSEDPRREEEGEFISSVPSAGPTPERLLFSVELKKKIEAAIAKLSDRERAAFVMRHFDGCSIEEIGKALGLRGSAAKNTIFRAVQKLREALQPMVNS
jgi:RNA polymerase sigma-70 factor (ECF subfamily)